MKFFHLAAQRNLKRILKTGLHLGSKRAQRGRGIYCVPQALLQHIDLTTQDRELDRIRTEGQREMDPQFQTGLVHTSNLWKFLFRYGKYYSRGVQAALIVFKIPERYYPLRFYLPCVLDRYDDVPVEHTGWEPGQESLLLLPKNANEVGMALHHWVQSGWVPTYSTWYDDVEIVIDYPIAANCITNVIPMYRSNRKFKILKSIKSQDDRE